MGHSSKSKRSRHDDEHERRNPHDKSHKRHRKEDRDEKARRSDDIEWNRVEAIVDMILTVFPNSRNDLKTVFETLDSGSQISIGSIRDTRMKELLKDMCKSLALKQYDSGVYGIRKHSRKLTSRFESKLIMPIDLPKNVDDNVTSSTEQKLVPKSDQSIKDDDSDSDEFDGPLLPGQQRPRPEKHSSTRNPTPVSHQQATRPTNATHVSLAQQHTDIQKATSAQQSKGRRFSWDRERDLVGGFKVDTKYLNTIANSAPSSLRDSFVASRKPGSM